MATATIKNLQIRISNDAEQAASSMERLRRSLQRLKEIASSGLNLDNVASGINRFAASLNNLNLTTQISQLTHLSNTLERLATNADLVISVNGEDFQNVVSSMEGMQNNAREVNQQTEEVRNNVRQTAPEVRRTNTELNKTHSAVGNIISSFKRILFYRIIRSSIKMITQGLSEGITNVVKYSSEAKASMDSFATASLYLKNSLGAALMPVLMKLIPYFQKFVDWVVKGIEAVSMFFAYLNGESTYLRAKEYFTEWGDGAEDAKEKTDKLKRSIMGFDEINALSDNTSSSSSSKKDDVNYGEMFESVPINMDTIAKLEKYYELVKLIGAAIAAWAVGKELISFMSWLKGLGILGKGIASVVVAVLEFKLVYDSMKNIFSGKYTVLDYVKAIGATILGSSFLYGILGPAGIVIGVGVALVATIAAKLSADTERELANSELYTEIQKTKDEISKNEEVIKEIAVNIDVRWGSINEILGNYSTAKELIDNIYALANKENKSEGDLAQLESLISTLNTLGFGELIGSYDKLTGKINATKDATLELLKTQVRASIQSAAYNNYGQNQIELVTAKKKLSNFQYLKTKAENEKGLALEQLNNLVQGNYVMKALGIDGYTDDLSLIITANMGLSPEYQAALKSYKDAKANIESATEDEAETAEIIKQLTEETAAYSDFLNGTFSVSIDDAGNAIITTASEAKQAIIENGGEISDDLESNLAGMQDSVSLWSDGVSTKIYGSDGSLIGTVKTKMSGLKTFIEALNPTLKIGVRFNESATKMLVSEYLKTHDTLDLGWYTYTSPTAYATGGFPEDGLFFANSGELVGGFSNGRTAVANNEQIIDGISRGVRNAMSDSAAGGDWTINVVDANGNVRGSTVVTAAERRNKRAGTTVIPVGV